MHRASVCAAFRISVWVKYAVSGVRLDLSRNFAAPLIAYYALKENVYGNETNGRIQIGSCARCADEWAEQQTSSIGLQYLFFNTVPLDQKRARQYYAH